MRKIALPIRKTQRYPGARWGDDPEARDPESSPSTARRLRYQDADASLPQLSQAKAESICLNKRQQKLQRVAGAP
jgi:hypothetical protein